VFSEYYGFREAPFQMTPDARLFFASTVHRRAYAHLMFGLSQREGFVVITGDVGAGKTTLIERLCSELQTMDFAIARIVTTRISDTDLLSMVADAFGVPPQGDKATLLRGITAALTAGGRRRHLLIVDEAQGLSESALEELRMLSNITQGERALLQTVLLGQPEFRNMLSSPSLAQLRQRILASYHLVGLSGAETKAYIMHRMRAVGWQGRPSWPDDAMNVIHAFTDGIPRRINRLCSRVLLSGALEHADEITAPMVEATAQELDADLSRPTGTSVASVPAFNGAEHPDMLRQIAERLDVLERRTDRYHALVSRILRAIAETEERQ